MCKSKAYGKEQMETSVIAISLREFQGTGIIVNYIDYNMTNQWHQFEVSILLRKTITLPSVTFQTRDVKI